MIAWAESCDYIGHVGVIWCLCSFSFRLDSDYWINVAAGILRLARHQFSTNFFFFCNWKKRGYFINYESVLRNNKTMVILRWCCLFFLIPQLTPYDWSNLTGLPFLEPLVYDCSIISLHVSRVYRGVWKS